MKLKTILLMAGLVCAGCTSINETITLPTGEVFKAKGGSFLTSMSGLKRTMTTPAGTVYAFSLDNYSSDNQAIATLVGGLENVIGMALMANNTNSVIHSNLMAALLPMMRRR
jgi:hypothetical protein